MLEQKRVVVRNLFILYSDFRLLNGHTNGEEQYVYPGVINKFCPELHLGG